MFHSLRPDQVPAVVPIPASASTETIGTGNAIHTRVTGETAETATTTTTRTLLDPASALSRSHLQSCSRDEEEDAVEHSQGKVRHRSSNPARRYQQQHRDNDNDNNNNNDNENKLTILLESHEQLLHVWIQPAERKQQQQWTACSLPIPPQSRLLHSPTSLLSWTPDHHHDQQQTVGNNNNNQQNDSSSVRELQVSPLVPGRDDPIQRTSPETILDRFDVDVELEVEVELNRDIESNVDNNNIDNINHNLNRFHRDRNNDDHNIPVLEHTQHRIHKRGSSCLDGDGDSHTSSNSNSTTYPNRASKRPLRTSSDQPFIRNGVRVEVADGKDPLEWMVGDGVSSNNNDKMNHHNNNTLKVHSKNNNNNGSISSCRVEASLSPVLGTHSSTSSASSSSSLTPSPTQQHKAARHDGVTHVHAAWDAQRQTHNTTNRNQSDHAMEIDMDISRDLSRERVEDIELLQGTASLSVSKSTTSTTPKELTSSCRSNRTTRVQAKHEDTQGQSAICSMFTDDGMNVDRMNDPTGQPVDYDIYRSFFLASPVKETEIEEVQPRIEQALETVINEMLERGADVYQEFKQRQQEDRAKTDTDGSIIHPTTRRREGQAHPDDDDDDNDDDVRLQQQAESLVIDFDPRSYQAALLQVARKQNTIIHLGTGTGKTLIALLLVKEYAAAAAAASDHDKNCAKRQIVFLVPSVALALQQSAILRNNVQYSVELACSSQVQCETSRQTMAQCSILVATHGAYVGLLSHYQDMFHLSNVALLIMDECHHCTGNNSYAIIMRQFYHELLPTAGDRRPHILGLTASPLINVKKNHTDVQLAKQIAELEDLMDSKIVAVDHCSELDLYTDTDVQRLMKEQAEETVEWYSPSCSDDLSWWRNVVMDNDPNLLYSRRREFNQLRQLGEDLGPLVLGRYATILQQELSRNMFENESTKQFDHVISLLRRIETECRECCQRQVDTGGRSNKLLTLERVLYRELDRVTATSEAFSGSNTISPPSWNTSKDVLKRSTSPGGSSGVGVVFVERRITALALKEYFRSRLEHLRVVHGPDDNASETTSTNAKSTQAQDESPYLEDTDLCGQFMDAEEDIDDVDYSYRATTSAHSTTGDCATPHAAAFPSFQTASMMDQFADPGPEVDPFHFLFEAPQPTENHRLSCEESSRAAIERTMEPPLTARTSAAVAQRRNEIRCSALVRQATDVFKSVAVGHRRSFVDEKRLREHWLHQEADIRQVISDLRSGKINVLIATSVVEEGIDVQACSFVIAFDKLSNIKGYIQMKGRARQEHARFLVFQPIDDDAQAGISLTDARSIEDRVRRFIASRRHIRHYKVQSFPHAPTDHSVGSELQAARRGYFEATSGRVTLLTAKSLLFRYSLNQPIDPAARFSRQALQAHLPLFDYDDRHLLLPAHIGASRWLRSLQIPPDLEMKNRRDRQNILALMACVRLYEHQLLSERLLPLKKADITRRVIEQTIIEGQGPCVGEKKSFIFAEDEEIPVFVYIMNQEGMALDNARCILKSRGHKLAIISQSCTLKKVPTLKLNHCQMGAISCSLCFVMKTTCTRKEICLLFKFFYAVMNARWRRRSRNAAHFVAGDSETTPSSTYLVGCVDDRNRLDWKQMQAIIHNCERMQSDLAAAVMSWSDCSIVPCPRIVSPIYSPNSWYIVYGPSPQTCDALFPHLHDNPKVVTYKDYYEIEWKIGIPSDTRLYYAQCLWHQPNRANDAGQDIHLQTESNYQWRSDLVPSLRCALLPKALCREIPFADAAFFLEALVLPQMLYNAERFLAAEALIQYCERRFPRLYECLESKSLESVIDMLSAKSCQEKESYDRLEWLGDAVLKVVQTDAILKSKTLGPWVINLHEGDLDAVRSVLGSNERLKNICQSTGIARFILWKPLSRSAWMPSALRLEPPPADAKLGPSDKVFADVMESILGFVYLNEGYDVAALVASELNLSIATGDENYALSAVKNHPMENCDILAVAAKFSGYAAFQYPALVTEAFTHPTSISPNTSSYQRLEWIGDAVLCLAAREWIFKQYSDNSVGDMVIFENTLVCNQTLAFLGLRHGLHKYIDYRDQTLPGRIDMYEWSVTTCHRGLWGTDPPKTIADVAEAILGAVHLDGGFAHGQRAALFALAPIRALFHSDNPYVLCSYPKRRLLEVGSSLLSVSCMTEKDFARKHAGRPVWLGDQWGTANQGELFIASVHCMDQHLVSVIGSSPSSAINRASAFVNECLMHKDGAMGQRFASARSHVLRQDDRPNQINTDE